jgi:raffinose/stachyose/melibiose transport system permease protein
MTHLVLIFFVLLAIVPVALIVMNSFKSTSAIFAGPFTPPNLDTLDLKGYDSVLNDSNFLGYYRNSIVVTVSSVALTVTSSAFCAWAISEYRVRLAPIIAGLFLVGIMLPIRLGTVPLLRMMVGWGLFDTPVALILVYTGMSLPVAVAVMLVYFRTVPRDLKDAARCDGAGELLTLRIALPIVLPALAAVATITMLPIWNDLWFPLILAPHNQTVTLGTQQFVGVFNNNWPALLAALTCGAVPLILLFTAFSRQFIRGLSAGFTR